MRSLRVLKLGMVGRVGVWPAARVFMTEPHGSCRVLGACHFAGIRRVPRDCIQQCCSCTDDLEYPPGHYMNWRCILCGHEIHYHCGTFLPGGHTRPPGYMCDCCEAPDTDTDDEDESRLHPTEARSARTHNVCTCRVPGEDAKQ